MGLRLPRVDYRLLIDALPLFIVIAPLAASVWLLMAPAGEGRVARGVLLSAAIVGAALIVGKAGLLIAVKHGVPGTGALLGATGALLIVAGVILGPWKSTSKDRDFPSPRTLRLVGPIGILFGTGVFMVALLMPWATRPHPMRLVWLPLGPYWIWSTVLPAAILFPTIFSAVRMLRWNREPQTDVGIALSGGMFATLLFLQTIGWSLLMSDHPLVRPVTPAVGAFMGLAAGSLMLVGATISAFSLRRARTENQITTPPVGEA